MTVQDNVGSYDQLAFGDGIVLLYSPYNTITGNKVTRNGIFENIGVLGHLSDHNLIQANTVTDSAGLQQGQQAIGINIFYSAFIDILLPDRGASQVGNQNIGNTVLRAYANGLSDRAFTQGQIIGNTVENSGVGDPGNGVGVGVLPLGASTLQFNDLVEHNLVLNNADCGIQTAGIGSRFISNTATGNAFYGCTDFAGGGNPPCPSLWLGNTYGTADGTCVTNGGHQVTPSPAPSVVTAQALTTSPTTTSPSVGVQQGSGQSSRSVIRGLCRIPGWARVRVESVFGL
ncbi:MAG: hypothetical protein M3083_03040 [Actinomycetota bacterium]|nr:hypothetical protein [Actinomycetota bacterium]